MLIERCLCGSTHYMRDVVIVAFGELPICACLHCGTKWAVTAWTLEQLDEYYASGRYHADTLRHVGVVPYKERYESDAKAAKARLDCYAKLVAWPTSATGRDRFRTCDVGAANGAFVDLLNSWGCNAIGMEPDRTFSRSTIYTGGVLDVEGPFDLITYHDVLEHVADPLAELAGAVTRLSEGGLLIVEVPDVHVTAGFKHFKTEHVWYFSLRTLLDLMTIPLGLELADVWYPIPGKLSIAVQR